MIHNNEVAERYITYYRNLKQKIIRNTYPLSRICKKMQQLQEFHYTTVLDLNMCYYTIDVCPEGCDFTTIVNEFGKLSYNRDPLVLCASSEKFQT